MHIRTFRAESLQDALAQIRAQMGDDASVLHTRQVRDGLMGWLGRTYVEVTAGLKDVSTSPEAVAGTVDPTNVACDPLLAALPMALSVYRDELLTIGVPPSIADRWLVQTAQLAGRLNDPAELSAWSPSMWFDYLQRTVAERVRVGGTIETDPGRRRIVALAGPTGVGKTTTVAKLAAGFRIQAQRRVGLITIDTFRIAAVEQLKAYAQIMDLPMEVVEDPSEMRPALGRLGHVDLILIDTAGRSPRSDARIDQLVELLRMAQPDETHLVLSGTSSSDSIAGALRGFAPVRPTAAILTKLDETTSTAGVLAALAGDVESQSPLGPPATRQWGASGPAVPGLPLSYVTHGQQVPDDIALADAETLLSRFMPGQPIAPERAAA